MSLKIRLVLLSVAFIIPLALWFFYKPVRTFFPVLVGMHCINKNICVENKQSYELSDKLYNEARSYLQLKIGSFESSPIFIFCETQLCFEKFGFKKASAQTLGTVATVVGPNGWKSYIVEHEMIHHIQKEKLGSFRFFSSPIWFIEGMAYSFSRDPRVNLEEPWQSYKTTFEQWYNKLQPEDIWEKANIL